MMHGDGEDEDECMLSAGPSPKNKGKPDALAQAEQAMKTNVSFDIFEKKVEKTADEKARDQALKGYANAMTKIGHKLLASGIDMGVVSEICAEPEDKSKHDAKT